MNQQTSKMNVTVTFKNLDSSDAVRDYAVKRASKIEKHLHTNITVQFIFVIEKTLHVAHMHVVAGEFEATGEARAETMYAAIDEVTDKVLQQTRKHKEMMTSHQGDGHHNHGDGDTNIVQEE